MSPPKTKNFQIKNSRQGGSNKYPQSMLLSKNKPQFYYITVGFKGVKII